MTEFRIAGSTNGSDEETLAQIVRIAGYTATLHSLVAKSFGFCPVHSTPVPKKVKRAVPRGRGCAPGCVATPPPGFHY